MLVPNALSDVEGGGSVTLGVSAMPAVEFKKTNAAP